MSRIDVQKIAKPEDRALPIFAEFEKFADRIRLQAYQLFAHRGAGDGHALDDWLAAEREVCCPAAELTETDDGYALKVALAGFEPKEIDVTATPREIMIKAAHRETQSGGDGEAVTQWSEFRSDDVFRRVELPTSVNVDKISANLRNGMLEVTAPKAAARGTASKKIELTSSS